MKRSLLLSGLATLLITPVASTLAADFTISNGQTVNSQQTLTNGQSGTIENGGTLSLSGGTVSVIMSGASSLLNAGTLRQTGSGRAVDSTLANANLTISNSGTITTVSTDAIRVNAANSAVSLTNSGTISVSAGGQAIDFAAISSASNTITNLSTGVISAVAEDAIRPGTNGVVNNAGTIQATPTSAASPSGSDGIDLRTFSGISVTNTGLITGRHGIATDGANAGPSTLTVTNNAGGTIAAINGSGINVDGVSSTVTANVTNASGATIRGGVLAVATAGDGDGVDIDGVLTLNNSGDILGYGAKGNGSDGQPNNAQGIAAGGGSITNTSTGRIIGSTLAADAPNGNTAREGHGILVDNSSGGNAVAATTIANSGLIQGKTGYGVRIIGTFADTITNNAGGTIRGTGTGAAIQTGGGGDTITNRGAIVGENGAAIDLEAGDDTLVIEGGAASIAGSVSGGTGTNTAAITPGVGNAFSYDGSLANFAAVMIGEGTTTFTGASSYTGTTEIEGTLVLSGANRLSAASTLTLDGGTLEFTGIGTAGGQAFAGLSVAGNSVIDLGFTTSILFDTFGSLTAGASLAILDYSDAVSANYAVRFLGDLTGDADFIALKNATTINGFAPTATFDGTYTNLTTTPVPEPSTVAIAAALLGFVGYRQRRRLVGLLGAMRAAR